MLKIKYTPIKWIFLSYLNNFGETYNKAFIFFESIQNTAANRLKCILELFFFLFVVPLKVCKIWFVVSGEFTQ